MSFGFGNLDLGALEGHIELDDEMTGALTKVSNYLTEVGQRFDNAFGGAALAAAGAVAAVGTVTAAVIALGVRGSDINAVSESLDHFAGSAANAENIVGQLSRGTKGTIDNFELMKTATGLLSANVKLTAEEFGTLGQAASVLADRGLGSTQQMLDLVSSAMVTGRTRALSMKLGVVDNTTAQEDYARSLGKTKAELTANEQATAMRISVMKMLRAATADAWTEEKNFAETLTAGTVAVKNWFIQLAQGVAASPNVMRAVRAIGDAISESFGGAPQTALQTILGWINKFADGVAHYGPIAIDWMRKIVDTVLSIVRTVKDAWDTVPEWFKHIAQEAALAGGALYVMNKTMGELSSPSAVEQIASLATIWSGFGQAITKAGAALKEWMLLIAAFKGEAVALMFTNIATAIEGVGVSVLEAVAKWPIGLAAAGAVAGYAWVNGFIGSVLGDKGLKGLQTDIEDALRGPLTAKVNTTEEYKLKVPIVPVADPKGLSKDIQDALDALNKGQRDALTSARAYAAFMGSNWQDKPIALQKEYLGTLQSVVDKFGDFSKLGPGAWNEIYEQLKNTFVNTRAADAEFNKYRADIVQANIAAEMEKIAAKTKAIADAWTQVRQLHLQATELDVRASMSPLEQTLRDIDQNLEEQKRKYERFHKDGLLSWSDYIQALNDLDAIAEDQQAKLGMDKAREDFNNLMMPPGGAQHPFFGDENLHNVNAALGTLANGFQQLAQIAGDSLSAVVRRIGTLISGLQLAGTSGEGVRDGWKQLSGENKNVAAGLANIAANAMGVYAAFMQMTTGVGRAQAALGGALAGVQAGAMFGPWGAAIGSVVGAIGGFVRGMTAGRRAVIEFADSFDTVAAGTGFDELHKELARLGKEGERLWITLTQGVNKGSPEEAQKAIEGVQEAIQALNDDIAKYNLTGMDFEDPVRQVQFLQDGVDDLVESYNRLRDAGYSADSILNGMSGDINKLLANFLKMGKGIPPALAPLIEGLIRSKKLTEENAAALLGLSDTAKPAYADIVAAAERYHFALDSLGDGVRQIRVTETAQQIVKDFDLMTRAGVSFETLMQDVHRKITDTGKDIKDMSQDQIDAYLRAGGVFTDVTDGMRKQVQDLVTESLEHGLELPKSMQPMIQRMIDAGLLVDQFGQKLEDTSGINWTTPLNEKIDELIGALRDLVDEFKKMADAAVIQAERVAFAARNGIDMNDPTLPRLPGGPLAPTAVNGSEGPAVDSSGGGGTVVVNLGARELARIIVPELQGASESFDLASVV